MIASHQKAHYKAKPYPTQENNSIGFTLNWILSNWVIKFFRWNHPWEFWNVPQLKHFAILRHLNYASSFEQKNSFRFLITIIIWNYWNNYFSIPARRSQRSRKLFTVCLCRLVFFAGNDSFSLQAVSHPTNTGCQATAATLQVDLRFCISVLANADHDHRWGFLKRFCYLHMSLSTWNWAR